MISSRVAAISQATSAGVPRRHRVVEHVAEPVAQPRLLLRRRLDRRAAAVAHRLRRADPQLLSRARHVFLSVPDPERPEFCPDDPPSPTTRASLARSGHADTPEAADRLARRAAALAFATQGLVFISLTTRLPRFSDRWDLSEVELSLVLLMIVLLAGAGSVVAELVGAPQRQRPHPARRAAHHRRRGPGGRPPRRPAWSSCSALAVYGVGLGIVDATSNMQAVAIEHRYGRPILPSFHGAWTFGGIIGACYALAAAHLPLWTAGLVAVVPLVALAAPYLRREHGEAAGRRRARRRPLAADLAGRARDGALLHGRHRRADLGTDLPRRRRRRPAVAGRAGDAALPGRQPGAAARRRLARGAVRRRAGPAGRCGRRPRWRCWSWSPRRPGRWRCSASPCSAPASR